MAETVRICSIYGAEYCIDKVNIVAMPADKKTGDIFYWFGQSPKTDSAKSSPKSSNKSTPNTSTTSSSSSEGDSLEGDCIQSCDPPREGDVILQKYPELAAMFKRNSREILDEIPPEPEPEPIIRDEKKRKSGGFLRWKSQKKSELNISKRPASFHESFLSNQLETKGWSPKPSRKELSREANEAKREKRKTYHLAETQQSQVDIFCETKFYPKTSEPKEYSPYKPNADVTESTPVVQYYDTGVYDNYIVAPTEQERYIARAHVDISDPKQTWSNHASQGTPSNVNNFNNQVPAMQANNKIKQQQPQQGQYVIVNVASRQDNLESRHRQYERAGQRIKQSEHKISLKQRSRSHERPQATRQTGESQNRRRIMELFL